MQNVGNLNRAEEDMGEPPFIGPVLAFQICTTAVVVCSEHFGSKLFKAEFRRPDGAVFRVRAASLDRALKL
jgi:hypothetical protein